MPYGHIDDPEKRAELQAELDAQFARIRDDELCCLACANARRKRREIDRGKGFEYDKEWRKASCKKHRMERQVRYNTSPLSEAYWTT